MEKIRTRFAPSPTGFLHIGNFRTALFAYLIARAEHGTLALRIEDTDEKRYVGEAEEALFRILDWSGLKFDEGPGIGGEYGPYVQSQRQAIYDKYRDEILAKGGAYHCFCSPERLEKMRAEQQANKQAPRYDRHCRDLYPEEVEERIKAGEKYVIRQKMPLDGEVVAHDELRGDIKFQASELEDHVLIKSSGMPTYQFAVVVDDHLMEITHVVRGEDWIPSFPKNILLYKSFGWDVPKFVHPPLILNKGGGKLSKRQGDVAVEDYRDKGYLTEALINFCALLGWHPKGDNEILTLKELEETFDYKNIGTSPAVFDIDKLDYFNGYYIRQKPLGELVELCRPFLEKNLALTDNPRKQSKDFITKVVELEQERLKKLSEIGELTRFFFVDKLDAAKVLLLLPWKKLTAEQARENLKLIVGLMEKIPEVNWTNDSLEEGIMDYLKKNELRVGEYLWPMRVALTGEKASPGPFDVAEVLGKAESLERIKALTI
ncbi:glutamate--tRNA ligase [Candidatus Falkowbacteria bacterium RIFOXYB2_FULL_47_14]|uniref:Glutamate--tRNA ligase n=1 Tax=Candidatus Falkowbacteria bacterium RIFOXYA2_FULL_47_19 TaxID=1797994 RepID=A0A1F5SP14_9BACT|nr:MAG: glutamate--tRNA ligase [Candidatus Falkowbacteria bacterium RIFOXYA2_FULL_47_19]OGF35118.1 MAG: glutamate--tRNA ligase [Candidatus Falkowbacteria bacterium RIFOXYC2_FULL_46_15]OGF43164.1 MAG: glutamate--tRNA ligase [Candidatus Falkowbacteria bacterium RIFOXYB2_FULL_47_14]